MSQRKAFFVSLVTEHLLAKFFALVFATTTILLIDREISTEILYHEGRVFVVPRLPDRLESGTPYIVVSADPGIWFNVPTEVPKLAISGPKNRRTEFQKNPIIRLRIRQERVLPGQAPAALDFEPDENSFESDIPDLVVRKTAEGFAFKVDRIITRDDVPFRVMTPANLPPSRVYDETGSVVTPSALSLRGPRHVIEVLASDKPAALVIDNGTKTGPVQDGAEYLLRLPDDLLQKSVVIANEMRPKVRLALKVPNFETVRIPGVPIHWGFTEEVRRAIAAQELEIVLDNKFVKEVDVELKGPLDIVRPYQNPDRKRELAAAIYVIADPNKDIAALTDGEKVVTVTLRVIGVPEGLDPILDPANLLITLRRKDADND